jgi:hypothetical protein
MWSWIWTRVLAYINQRCCFTCSTESFPHFPRITIKIPLVTRNGRHAYKFDIIGRRKSSGMWRCGTGLGFPDASNEYSAFIFKSLRASEEHILRSLDPSTQFHIPENKTPQLNACGNLNFHLTKYEFYVSEVRSDFYFLMIFRKGWREPKNKDSKVSMSGNVSLNSNKSIIKSINN